MKICTTPIQTFKSYIPILTKPVTLSSISLSLRPGNENVSSLHVEARYVEVSIVPAKDSCFSFPCSVSDLSASIQRVEVRLGPGNGGRFPRTHHIAQKSLAPRPKLLAA